jgi:hypothetical protein
MRWPCISASQHFSFQGLRHQVSGYRLFADA